LTNFVFGDTLYPGGRDLKEVLANTLPPENFLCAGFIPVESTIRRLPAHALD
jgi:hypothetical protein